MLVLTVVFMSLIVLSNVLSRIAIDGSVMARVLMSMEVILCFIRLSLDTRKLLYIQTPLSKTPSLSVITALARTFSYLVSYLLNRMLS